MAPNNSYESVDVSGHTHPTNFGERVSEPVGVCVHTTAGANSLAFLQSDRRFTTGASCADFLINRYGDRFALIPEGKFAYHVGQGRWGKVTNTRNTLSQTLIGVELEQQDDELCTWQQLDSLAQLIVLLAPLYVWRWPFVILGHYELATPIGRRSDPQGFDWGAFMGFLFTHTWAANIAGIKQL